MKWNVNICQYYKPFPALFKYLETYRTKKYCFCEFFHRSHSNLCVHFWWVISKTAFVFDVVGGNVRLSSMKSCWSFAISFLLALLNWIVKSRKWMRLCGINDYAVPSYEVQKMNGPVSFFFKLKCTANVLCPISKLHVVVVWGSSNWPFATCIWKLRGSLILKTSVGACGLMLSESFSATTLT